MLRCVCVCAGRKHPVCLHCEEGRCSPGVSGAQVTQTHIRHPPVILQLLGDVPSMQLLRCIGGCVPFFLFAVALDVVGVILLFVGIFANLRLDGRFYGDFLIYTGALVVFFSLGCWLMWYVGNVPVSEDDGLRKTSSIVRLARKLSERLSQTLKRGEDRQKCVQDEECHSQASPPARKASRVTWGKSTAYHNDGYDYSLDSEEKRVEAEREEEEVDI